MAEAVGGEGFLKQLQEEFVPHLLELQVSEDPMDGISMAVVLVVIRKTTGILLAVPEGFLAEELLSAGLLSGPDEMIGPSHRVAVPGGVWDPVIGGEPVEEAPVTVPAVLVDALASISEHMRVFNPSSDPVEVIQHFMEPRAEIFPMPEPLITAAMEWVTNPAAGERVNYYSADDVGEEEQEILDVPDPETPVPKAGSAKAKATPNGGVAPGTGGGKASPVQKVKKPTVATLASSVESLVSALPVISNQLAELARRQSEVESRFQQGTRISTLAAPLGGSATIGSSAALPKFQQMLSEMPPPKAPAAARAVSKAEGNFAASTLARQEEVKQLEIEGESSSSDLARAVLAQSQALTALVGQIAQSSDPLADISSSSSSFSSRGAMGRAKLQQELASQKGTFFLAVCQNMARRMTPSQMCDQQPMELHHRGVSATRYLERFGGFGKVKDLGQIAWQIGIIMDHLQCDNVMAAKDATSLLLVCLEQAAMDAGHLEIGLLLSLCEDPPAGLFSNRSLAPLSKGKSFAPLADQKWISLALSYIKELDVITQKRADLAGAPVKLTSAAPAPTPTPKPKPKTKKGAWKKNQRSQEDAEGEE